MYGLNTESRLANCQSNTLRGLLIDSDVAVSYTAEQGARP